MSAVSKLQGGTGMLIVLIVPIEVRRGRERHVKTSSVLCSVDCGCEPVTSITMAKVSTFTLIITVFSSTMDTHLDFEAQLGSSEGRTISAGQHHAFHL